MVLLLLSKSSPRLGLVSTVALAFLLCAFLPASGHASPDSHDDVPPQRLSSAKIVALINTYRSKKGLTPLRQNPRLGIGAGLKVKDMIEQSYFAHTNPEGLPFSHNIKEARCDYRSVAEVLAKGCKSEVQVLNMWAKSRSHSDALLNQTFLDVNCSSSISQGMTYVACHLGRPRMLASSPSRRYQGRRR
jgi:uncharacterized protein YkwD